MTTSTNFKLALFAVTILGFAAAPAGLSAAEKKVIIKEPEKHKEIIVKEKKEVVVRPVRVWEKKPHYGQVIGGVTLGTIIGPTVIGVAPVAPAGNVCWYWTNPHKDKGYWDYC